MKINKLIPLEKNPFKGSGDDQIKKIAASIETFGKMMEIRKIVIDEAFTILGGNKRYFACKELGMKDIPDSWIDQRTDLTEAEKKEFIVKDNAHWGSEWDYDLLKEWDVDLDDWGVDLPDGWEDEKTEAIEDNYEIPDEIETDIVLGDLFEIGEHRLLCGNSTDSDSVAKLMNGQKADMVFTDPPYDLEKEDYAENILLSTENAHVFVMHDDKGLLNYLKRSQLDFNRFFVADFNFASPRGNDPYLRHILISHEKKGNAIPHQNHHDGLSSIIKFDYRGNLKEEKHHDHQKPINFISKFITHYSKENSNILDLFLGSGTTMVASHQLKRKCYGMEIDCKYCQVIIDRMKKLDPDLVIKKNGTELPN